MPSDQDIRKTHITRITGTNRDGDRLDDMWLDLERIDVITVRSQRPIKVPNDLNNDPIILQSVEIDVRFHWHDDPDNPDPIGAPIRTTETLKVYDVESEGLTEDPDEWIPVEVIKTSSVYESGVGGDIAKAAEIVKRFVNGVIKASTSEGTRESQPRRFTHWDTSMDDAAQSAFDADETRTKFVLGDPRQYSRTDDTRDDDQYVEHEVIEKLHRKESYDYGRTNGLEVETVFTVHNEYLYDESDPAHLDDVGGGGYNPPFRLDPFQNILNVSFGGLAVEFLSGIN